SGPLRLAVEGARLLHGDETVYEATTAGDVLGCLDRDGVTRLTFLPGLEETELHDFLVLLHRASLPGRDEDLAALLWERDLPSIVHALVEDLAPAPGDALGDLAVSEPRPTGSALDS